MTKRKKLQWARSLREKKKEWELKKKVEKYKEEKKKKKIKSEQNIEHWIFIGYNIWIQD